VELEKGVEGLIHVSEMADERVDDPRKLVKPGDAVRAEVITVDNGERKIALSMRSAARMDEVADVQGYAPGGARSTLGDLLKSKLGDLNLKPTDGE
jgi:small subunit ribosomal protein S1